ncbi:hypothetical protein ATN85_10330 [Staphylococcus hominis]|uniref:hypothetical protein n=1 Tax=Staphylococcus hominis TaxID=1290 RepID=UPI0009A3B02F|nr:hypothetical protein [Staphylococcus hominis]MCI2899839.1 hypothetical protein [Staphylococcus hominis]OPF66054.1 hypothetical protein ATN85_10330 [Staphylococcus hominis]
MFEKLFNFSVIIFLIDLLFVGFKNLFLGGELTTSGNGFLLFLTIIFTILMVLTTIFFIRERKSKVVQDYKYMYYTTLVCTPFVWVVVMNYILSPLPEFFSFITF